MKIADELSHLLWSEIVTERDLVKEACERYGHRLFRLNVLLNKMKAAGLADHLLVRKRA